MIKTAIKMVKIANVLEVSVDSLLFADLNTQSGNNHFLKKIAELTDGFTTQEKELLLKNIELINEFRSKVK